MKKFKQVAIIGVGLIGGSMGMAIKKKRLAGEVIGIGRNLNRLKLAVRLGAIDRGTLDLAEGVGSADVIVLATPICNIIEFARRVSKLIKEGAILTDVGSTKSEVVKKVEKSLCKGRFFVGTHPMAGSEKVGVANASPDLFVDSTCLITRTPGTDKKALNSVEGLWRALGAKTRLLTPGEHDRIVSRVSHLPHLVAAGLVESVDNKSLRFSSTGLKGTTRVASGDPVMWRDICLTNKAEILRALNSFSRSLKRLQGLVKKGDGRGLLREFKRAKRIRDNIDRL